MGGVRVRLPPALLAGLFAAAYVLCRVGMVESGDVRQNVLVGGRSAPGGVPGSWPVFAGAGYDGQFYYRLAVDPFRLDGLVRGIQIDSPVRLQRIGYPFLTWLGSAGQAGAVPYVLIAVNVLAFAALGGVGAALARRYGRPPVYGLLFCAFPGFLVTLARDLTELLAAALVLAALLALLRGRSLLTGVVLAAAVLTRETALILAAAALLTSRRGTPVRAWWRPIRDDLAWALPVAAYVAWQAVVALAVGHLPARAEHDNLAVPFVAPWHAVGDSFADGGRTGYAFALTSIALLVLVGLVVHAGRGAPRVVLWAFGLSVALTASLSRSVWNGDVAELRTFMDVHLYGVAALLAVRPRYLTAYAVVLIVPFVLTVIHYGSVL